MGDRTLSVMVSLCRHGEALGQLYAARLELVLRGWDRTVDAARERSAATEARRKATTIAAEDTPRAVERALWRMSRLVPGATCIHRALAAQRMLIRRGLAAEIVIGLRRGDGAIEGHAWVEGSQFSALFLADAAGYRPIL